VSSANAAPFNSSDRIGRLERQWVRAFAEGDRQFIAQHLSDDYTGVGPGGKLVTKDALLEDRSNALAKYEPLDLQDVAIHLYEDTAVVTGRFKAGADSYRYLRVWVNVGGIWKVAASQVTRISE
jgi:hypothetical protein